MDFHFFSFFLYWVGPVAYLELFWVGPVKKNTLYIDPSQGNFNTFHPAL